VSTMSSGVSSIVSSDSLSTRYSSSSASHVAVLESFPNCFASSFVKPLSKAIARNLSIRRQLMAGLVMANTRLKRKELRSSHRTIG